MWPARLKWGDAPLKDALFGPPPAEGEQRRSFLARYRYRIAAVMLFLATLATLFYVYRLSFSAKTPYSEKPRTPLYVNLVGYGTFQGTQILSQLWRNIPFKEPVDAWLGINYATQPVGEDRWKPVTWPAELHGTQDASEYGPICIQHAGGALQQSEACLNFNVYRTSGVSYRKKLPVMVFIHGGSFVGGHGRSFDGAAFVAHSINPIMVVTFQYRLGALASLPADFMEEEGLLNFALQDQRMLLEFLQKHISTFGGDPERITLAGQSAGGHSVGLLLFHDYGSLEGKRLFSQAILSSGSSTARAFPNATYPLYERQLDQFMRYINCPTSPTPVALKCLRSTDVSKIQYISAAMYGQSTYNITWPWQPVSPGPLLEHRGSQSGIEDTFFHIPTLMSNCNDEGKMFSPRNLTTNAQFLAFMKNLAPGLTDADIADLEELYPDPESATTYADSPKSPQFDRVSAAYGDYSYICPVQESAHRMAKARVPIYKARFNTPPGWAQSWEGVPHASDAGYFNGVPDVKYPEISKLYHSYWASFVVSGDPNMYAIPGAPLWELYEGLGGRQMVVGNEARGGTYLEAEKEGIRMKACLDGRGPEPDVKLDSDGYFVVTEREPGVLLQTSIDRSRDTLVVSTFSWLFLWIKFLSYDNHME
ncbi:alpha/beta-hydrolase [Amniculicola lignicola CBS 123094]|uniref:Carboxylic ester hydrolase n=1 Tax=Amniculicola lignicola CBS 123094 TaxID=1392246 RepID=A0A6A5WKL3_9PLEO|nr:alpha/beta-hydrolase [Amniculicola lignicola CBS 123094]